MKILKEKYPMGTYKGQKSDGKYMDGYLHDNLEILADRIVDDMTFMGVIFSSTLEVGTGKSVMATQIGEAWSEIMKQKHNIDVPFTMNNVVFKPKDLIERSFQLPRYSCILLDEWEDQGYWTQLGMTLRQFFRKCRQLNLLMLVIIPNWFQLNLSYAISRSAFAIDVRFEQDFRRGFFSFYSFQAKRILYIKGKKEHNYSVARPTFYGRFVDGYGVDEGEYRRKKHEDMLSYEQDKEPNQELVEIAEKKITKQDFRKMRNYFNKIPMKELAKAFGVSENTGFNWMKDDIAKELPTTTYLPTTYNSELVRRIDWSNEDQLEQATDEPNKFDSDDNNSPEQPTNQPI